MEGTPRPPPALLHPPTPSPSSPPAQRYIARLAVLQSPLSAAGWVAGPAVSADDAVVAERLRPLSRLYASLGEAVELEASGRGERGAPRAAAALWGLAGRQA
jgi:hypothetical protein